ncbi:trypsin-like peptidase domain-containing protein [Clostridium sp. SYSU_GA19001]|uniref:S1C family serine protease n=1 Tax=Clostridium caldaquaticum TaxID=2940653 RepID=UPI002077319A|nr:trypsin-like peptidase domain-containing protein [Clostridium caldaquaticum]MCM8711490.1 trypsin-like peptidase domain-containing protein [Clostridium caldaquaticum]
MGLKKKIASYIAVGLVCSTIGGGAAAFGTLYVLPNSTLLQNTPLYKSIESSMQNSLKSNAQNNLQNSSETKNTGSSVSLTTVSATTNSGVSSIVKKVASAVVGVATKSISTVQNQFGRYTQGQEVEGIGSGVIFSKEGYVLTNYHVIEGAQQVKVILSSGKEVNAKVVNYDANMDVAVVKITDNVEIPGVAEFGDSDSLEVGELAVAIGNPLGKEFLGSVTTGVISALNREVEIENKTLTLIQTDAAINPGNSGGPLVNSNGQVIGINTAKLGGNGVEGLGFAIPINSIKPKIESLLKPILKIGISGTDIDEQLSKQYNLSVGVYIQDVQAASPAQKAGLKDGDIIVKIDGQKISSVDDINAIKSKHNEGDIIKIEVIRDGENKILDLKLE